MVACVLQLAIHRLRAGSFKTMHVITTCVVLVLGTATLPLHDQRFIQWKLTVLLALKQTLAEPILGLADHRVVREFLRETAHGLLGERIVAALHVADAEVEFVLGGRRWRQGGQFSAALSCMMSAFGYSAAK